jgi:DNA repair exonuclease SbcCD ATPase subunit
MELEKRLEKWDALFEELRKVVEEFLPTVEKSIKEVTNKVSELEQRMSVFEKELADIRMQTTEKSQNVEDIKNSFLSVVEDLNNSLNAEISNLRNELYNQIDELKKNISDVGVSSPGVDLEDLKNLEKEIDEVRGLIVKLSKELEQFRNQMVEKHRIIREKKVEGKSPRIL